MNKIAFTPSYADQINNQYNQTTSHFVPLDVRMSAHVTSPYHNAVLVNVPTEWKRRNPATTNFNDLMLCEGKTTTLDRLYIDTTMQRPLNIAKVFKILNEWMDTKVMAINVYVDPTKPDEFIAWDGQHTAVALFILAKYILKTPLSACKVPIVKYAYKSKPQIRQMFIGLNGEDKTPLDSIDIFKQLIHTVRTDGDTQNEIANKAELKQQHLENYGLFATADKYEDENQPGAISRMQEINKYEPSVLLHFAKYFQCIGQSRNVDPNEIMVVMEYFYRCEISNIDISDTYIQAVANVMLTQFKGDLSAGNTFWVKAQNAYNFWHMKAYAGLNMNPRFNKNLGNGMTFMTAAMETHLGMQTPNYEGKFAITTGMV